MSRLGEGLDAGGGAGARDIDPALYSKLLDRNSVYVIGQRALLEGRARSPIPPARIDDGPVCTTAKCRTRWERGAWRRLGVIKPQAIDLFDSGGLMLEAAAQGLGVRVHACQPL